MVSPAIIAGAVFSVFFLIIVITGIIFFVERRRRTVPLSPTGPRGSTPECFIVLFTYFQDYIPSQGNLLPGPIVEEFAFRGWDFATAAQLTSSIQAGAQWSTVGVAFDPVGNYGAAPDQFKPYTKFKAAGNSNQVKILPLDFAQKPLIPVTFFGGNYELGGVAAWGIKESNSSVNPPGAILPFNSEEWLQPL